MMSGPELPYKISSSEEATACLRKMTKICLDLKEINQWNTKIVDDLRNYLRLGLNKVQQRYQEMLQDFKLQMQPQAVPVSDSSILTKPTSRKIVISSDLAPDSSAGLDYDGVISQGFRGTSNHDPHISRLWTQTRFFTHLSCDIEPDITKPTSRKIFVSSDLALDLSAPLYPHFIIY